MTFIYIYVFFLSVNYFILISRHGRIGMMFSSFFFCLVTDQFKSFITLGIVYIVIVRRFMHLEINEEDFIDPGVMKLPKQERAIPKLKDQCLKFLESPPIESFSMIIISVYAFFVIFWLTHVEFIPKGQENPIPENLMINIDSVFLTFFMVEIVLKTFASNMIYLKDWFSLFDAVIVMVSAITNMMGMSIKGLGVLRLIRVVVIILKKITDNTVKLKH